jgi:hypothetical protein
MFFNCLFFNVLFFNTTDSCWGHVTAECARHLKAIPGHVHIAAGVQVEHGGPDKLRLAGRASAGQVDDRQHLVTIWHYSAGIKRIEQEVLRWAYDGLGPEQGSESKENASRKAGRQWGYLSFFPYRPKWLAARLGCRAKTHRTVSSSSCSASISPSTPSPMPATGMLPSDGMSDTYSAV